MQWWQERRQAAVGEVGEAWEGENMVTSINASRVIGVSHWWGFILVEGAIMIGTRQNLKAKR